MTWWHIPIQNLCFSTDFEIYLHIDHISVVDGENSGEETDSYVGDDESGVSKNGMQSQDGDMESVQSSQDLICPGDDNDYEETGSSSIVQTNTESNQGTTKKRKRKLKKPKDGKTKKKKKVKKEGNHRKNIRWVICVAVYM